MHSNTSKINKSSHRQMKNLNHIQTIKNIYDYITHHEPKLHLNLKNNFEAYK